MKRMFHPVKLIGENITYFRWKIPVVPAVMKHLENCSTGFVTIYLQHLEAGFEEIGNFSSPGCPYGSVLLIFTAWNFQSLLLSFSIMMPGRSRTEYF